LPIILAIVARRKDIMTLKEGLHQALIPLTLLQRHTTEYILVIILNSHYQVIHNAFLISVGRYKISVVENAGRITESRH
jgi:hypothetical protein